MASVLDSKAINNPVTTGISTPHSSSSSEWFEAAGSVIGTAGRGLLLTDTSGCIRQTNDRFLEIIGYTSEELVGNNPRMFQSGNTAPSTYRSMWNELSSGRSWRGMLQNRRKNGTTFIEDITITPVTSTTGEIISFLGIVELVDTPSPLSRPPTNEEAKDTVLWISKGIAHEVNNALTAIIGNCSLAGRELTTSSKAYPRLEKITDVAYRLHAFSNRLSICSGLPMTDAKKIDLNEQVMEALDEIELICDISQVICKLSEYPIYVTGSAAMIQQSIRELVFNALESGTPAESDITVSVSKTVWEGSAFAEGVYSQNFGIDPGEVACIEIVDCGSGMEPTLLTLSTELFFSTKPTHAGLGLPAVIGIVRSHRGALEVRSGHRFGTTVRLFLPLSGK